MWRLWNKLFGWHYVAVEWREYRGIKRCQRTDKGWCVFIEIDHQGNCYRFLLNFDRTAFTCAGHILRYVPLTFKPEELIK